mgnify:FL=1
MTNSSPKPQPVSQPESDKYWDGLKGEKIWLQRCKTTGKYQFYPRSISIHDPESGPEAIEWIQVSGKATLYTYTIVHIAPHFGFTQDIPYIAALVELDEGVIIPTNIVGVSPEPENLQIGMKLKPVFDHQNNGYSLLKFTPE